MSAIPKSVDVKTCPCYGCAIARKQAGIAASDRSAEPCKPPGACASHQACWTHSEWTDEDPGANVVPS